MSDHYTAVIKITKSVTPPASSRGAILSEPKREVIEIASVVVRSETLGAVIAKAISHLDLVEE